MYGTIETAAGDFSQLFNHAAQQKEQLCTGPLKNPATAVETDDVAGSLFTVYSNA